MTFTAYCETESKRKAFIRTFFPDGEFNRFKETKHTHVEYTRIQIPRSVREPEQLISDCALVMELLNDTIVNMDLDTWTYSRLLDHIDGIFESEEIMHRADPEFCEHMMEKEQREFERQQVVAVIAIADIIANRQLNFVLGK
jgi:hypothetical protein